jgi:adenylate kinase
MRIVLIGPPGSGKGTQAIRLAGRYGVPAISTGDMFRQAVRARTRVGRAAKEYMDQGLLVPDDVTIEAVKERLREQDTRGGFILDGFPRSLEQATALDMILREAGVALDVVISLEVPEHLLVRRATGRRCCRCGATYHITNDPPEVEGKCDECGQPLFHRRDDTEEVISERLKTYLDKTEPIKEYYRKQGILLELDGSGSIQHSSAEVDRALEMLF